MDYQTYWDRAQHIADLTGRGEYEAALDVVRELLSSGISDVDKSIMCVNGATICQRMGDVDGALRWYATGEDYERLHKRMLAAESKAAYLSELGRDAECLRAYELLRRELFLTEEEKHRIDHNMAVLRQRMG